MATPDKEQSVSSALQEKQQSLGYVDPMAEYYDRQLSILDKALADSKARQAQYAQQLGQYSTTDNSMLSPVSNQELDTVSGGLANIGNALASGGRRLLGTIAQAPSAALEYGLDQYYAGEEPTGFMKGYVDALRQQTDSIQNWGKGWESDVNRANQERATREIIQPGFEKAYQEWDQDKIAAIGTFAKTIFDTIVNEPVAAAEMFAESLPNMIAAGNPIGAAIMTTGYFTEYTDDAVEKLTKANGGEAPTQKQLTAVLPYTLMAAGLEIAGDKMMSGAAKNLLNSTIKGQGGAAVAAKGIGMGLSEIGLEAVQEAGTEAGNIAATKGTFNPMEAFNFNKGEAGQVFEAGVWGGAAASPIAGPQIVKAPIEGYQRDKYNQRANTALDEYRDANLPVTPTATTTETPVSESTTEINTEEVTTPEQIKEDKPLTETEARNTIRKEVNALKAKETLTDEEQGNLEAYEEILDLDSNSFITVANQIGLPVVPDEITPPKDNIEPVASESDYGVKPEENVPPIESETKGEPIKETTKEETPEPIKINFKSTDEGLKKSEALVKDLKEGQKLTDEGKDIVRAHIEGTIEALTKDRNVDIKDTARRLVEVIKKADVQIRDKDGELLKKLIEQRGQLGITGGAKDLVKKVFTSDDIDKEIKNLQEREVKSRIKGAFEKDADIPTSRAAVTSNIRIIERYQNILDNNKATEEQKAIAQENIDRLLKEKEEIIKRNPNEYDEERLLRKTEDLLSGKDRDPEYVVNFSAVLGSARTAKSKKTLEAVANNTKVPETQRNIAKSSLEFVKNMEEVNEEWNRGPGGAHAFKGLIVYEAMSTEAFNAKDLNKLTEVGKKIGSLVKEHETKLQGMRLLKKMFHAKTTAEKRAIREEIKKTGLFEIVDNKQNSPETINSMKVKNGSGYSFYYTPKMGDGLISNIHKEVKAGNALLDAARKQYTTLKGTISTATNTVTPSTQSNKTYVNFSEENLNKTFSIKYAKSKSPFNVKLTGTKIASTTKVGNKVTEEYLVFTGITNKGKEVTFTAEDIVNKPSNISEYTNKIIKGTISPVEGTSTVTPTSSTIQPVAEPTEASNKATVDYTVGLSGTRTESGAYNKDNSVDVLRKYGKYSQTHFGNPFGVTGIKTGADIRNQGTGTEVSNMYKDWITGTPNTKVTSAINSLSKETRDRLEQRRTWIVEQIKAGKLDGKKLIYMPKPNSKEGDLNHAEVLAELVNNKKWINKSEKSKPKFKLTPNPNVSETIKRKDQEKANDATHFIGENVPGSSTGRYLQNAKDANIPVYTASSNVNVYRGAKAFVSVPGKGRQGQEQAVTNTITNATAFLERGGTLLMDTEENANSNHNAPGEGKVQQALKDKYGEDLVFTEIVSDPIDGKTVSYIEISLKDGSESLIKKENNKEADKAINNAKANTELPNEAPKIHYIASNFKNKNRRKEYLAEDENRVGLLDTDVDSVTGQKGRYSNPFGYGKSAAPIKVADANQAGIAFYHWLNGTLEEKASKIYEANKDILASLETRRQDIIQDIVDGRLNNATQLVSISNLKSRRNHAKALSRVIYDYSQNPRKHTFTEQGFTSKQVDTTEIDTKLGSLAELIKVIKEAC